MYWTNGSIVYVYYLKYGDQPFPACSQVPADLLPALEEHLRDLESGKKTTGSSSAAM